MNFNSNEAVPIWEDENLEKQNYFEMLHVAENAPDDALVDGIIGSNNPEESLNDVGIDHSLSSLTSSFFNNFLKEIPDIVESINDPDEISSTHQPPQTNNSSSNIIPPQPPTAPPLPPPTTTTAPPSVFTTTEIPPRHRPGKEVASHDGNNNSRSLGIRPRQNKGGRKRKEHVWMHATQLTVEGRQKFKCNYCKKDFWGAATRVNAHLRVCVEARNKTVETIPRVVDRSVDETTEVITMPLNEVVGAADLDYETRVEGYMSAVRNSWYSTGCTVLGYWDENGPQLNGITVYCPKGVIYLDCTRPEEMDKLLLEKTIQDLCHLPSNVYSTVTDGSIDYDTPGMPEAFSKTKCNVCSHSIILSVLNKMYEKCTWLHDLLSKADKIVAENIFHIPVEESENPFYKLQLVIKNKTTVQEHSTSVDKLDDEFWKNGKDVLDAIGPLVQILHVFETFVPNIGYLYQAFNEAQERMNLLQPRFHQLKRSFQELKDFSITNMHFAAACLNPAYMYYNDDPTIIHRICEEGLFYMKQHLVAESEYQTFADNWKLYVGRNSSLFTEPAKANLNKLHPGFLILILRLT